MTNIIGGMTVAGTELATFEYDQDANAWISNISIASDANVVADGIEANGITTTGDINVGGNIFVNQSFEVDSFTATGNINADQTYIDGLATVGALRSRTTLISPIITSDSITTNSISVANGISFTGNITVNSLTSPTANLGNIQLSANTIYTSTGNLTLEPHPPGLGGTINLNGNAYVGGTMLSTGNITAPYYFGDGSQLTGISGGGGLGVGQTWQRFVNDSRALNTVYTNLTSKPIAVSASVAGVTGGSPVTPSAYIDGIQVAINQVSCSSNAPPISTIFIIVPVGSSYQIQDYTSGHSIQNWAELR